VIEVTDAGPGIAPELYDYVLKPFARIEGARRRTTGSIGLGLAIVKSVVTTHRGELLFDQKEGDFCVTMRIPRNPGVAPWSGV